MVILSEKEQLARTKLCLPLDNVDLEGAQELVGKLHPYVGLFKIGFELFTKEGLNAIYAVQTEGGDVFLDLKYKDIPNTVKGAARAAASQNVDMFNLHIDGGVDMMKAAVEGVKEYAAEYNLEERPKILGVTVLTSINDDTLQNQIRVPYKVPDQVLHLARLAEQSGLDGIVCSAADLYAVRDHLRKDFMYVTPGIQAPISGVIGADQKRVFTPYNAIKGGSSILVVGRAITKPPDGDMQKAAYEVLQDMVKAM